MHKKISSYLIGRFFHQTSPVVFNERKGKKRYESLIFCELHIWYTACVRDMVMVDIGILVGNTFQQMDQNKSRIRCHALAYIGNADNSIHTMSSSAQALAILAWAREPWLLWQRLCGSLRLQFLSSHLLSII